MPGRFGEKVVIRVIDNDATRLNLETLGFAPDLLKRWRRVVARPNGIVLVTGPTGSGKSTTLYASLCEVNRADVNLCTIEDPIENQIEGVNQFQVHNGAGFTFAAALRSLLRQDPDVIMVGEVRDAETAKLAAQASLTGHLVFSTLHTNDACGAAVRLYNLGVEPYLVGATVGGILAQRLVRRLCLSCRKEVEPSPKHRKQLGHLGEVDHAYEPAGCSRCRNTGFSGRIGIHELLVPDEALVAAIAARADAAELRRLGTANGMKSLRDDALQKVLQGVTTLDEVNRAAA
jgi:type II secretory ATPase GspE/PulE/Tfp pilus assembly ATPase PilB-like protein